MPNSKIAIVALICGSLFALTSGAPASGADDPKERAWEAFYSNRRAALLKIRQVVNVTLLGVSSDQKVAEPASKAKIRHESKGMLDSGWRFGDEEGLAALIAKLEFRYDNPPHTFKDPGGEPRNLYARLAKMSDVEPETDRKTARLLKEITGLIAADFGFPESARVTAGRKVAWVYGEIQSHLDWELQRSRTSLTGSRDDTRTAQNPPGPAGSEPQAVPQPQASPTAGPVAAGAPRVSLLGVDSEQLDRRSADPGSAPVEAQAMSPDQKDKLRHRLEQRDGVEVTDVNRALNTLDALVSAIDQMVSLGRSRLPAAKGDAATAKVLVKVLDSLISIKNGSGISLGQGAGVGDPKKGNYESLEQLKEQLLQAKRRLLSA
ncbi:MAG: hypothetical protein HY815_05765, partial [Candidatus Riflebacteria bacterium]|nr:hypothetical protein [Candidatus Riflebacteria bacterium]